MVDIEKNKAKISSMLRKTKREGVDALIEHMENGGFFTAPCSGAYHLCCEGGLAEHSLNVWKAIANIKNGLWANYPEGTPENIEVDSLVIVSLLHDLGKMGDFGKPNYTPNILKSGLQSESKPYETNKDLLPIPHEVRSIKIASKFIELTEQEEWAIQMHNGLYGDFKHSIQGHETPLYMLLHWADMWASRVMEL